VGHRAGLVASRQTFVRGSHRPTHPELVIAVMNAASSDWAAARLGVAVERVAEALLVEEEAQQHIVPQAPTAPRRWLEKGPTFHFGHGHASS
jgi:hypothetical protein